jgi:hypothetical protein
LLGGRDLQSWPGGIYHLQILSAIFLFVLLDLQQRLWPSAAIMVYMYAYVSVTVVALLLVYLWFANRAMTRQYPEAHQHAQKMWTDTEMKKVYDEASQGPVDVRPYLPPKQDERRYIVLGGSG